MEKKHKNKKLNIQTLENISIFKNNIVLFSTYKVNISALGNEMTGQQKYPADKIFVYLKRKTNLY